MDKTVYTPAATRYESSGANTAVRPRMGLHRAPRAYKDQMRQFQRLLSLIVSVGLVCLAGCDSVAPPATDRANDPAAGQNVPEGDGPQLFRPITPGEGTAEFTALDERTLQVNPDVEVLVAEDEEGRAIYLMNNGSTAYRCACFKECQTSPLCNDQCAPSLLVGILFCGGSCCIGEACSACSFQQTTGGVQVEGGDVFVTDEDTGAVHQVPPAIIGPNVAITVAQRLDFTCDGVGCACRGDRDCNDMFESGVCGDLAVCDESGPVVECGCRLLRTPPAAVDDPNLPGGVVEVTHGNRVVGQAQFTNEFLDLTDRVSVIQQGNVEDDMVIDLEDESVPPFEVGNVILVDGAGGQQLLRVAGIRAPDRIFAGARGEVVAVDFGPVELGDIFESLEIRMEDQPLEAPEGMAALSRECRSVVDNAQIAASACYEVDVNPAFNVDFVLDLECVRIPFIGCTLPTGIREFKFILTGGVFGEVSFEAAVKQPFDRKRFETVLTERPIPLGLSLDIGPLSLGIDSRLALIAGIEGEAQTSGTISGSGSIGVGWRIGIECPRDKKCRTVNVPLLPSADADLDYRVNGLAQLRAFAGPRISNKINVDIIVQSGDLASLDLGLETYLDVRSRPLIQPTSPIPLAGDLCSGLVSFGTERVRFDLAAGALARIAGKVLFGLWEDETSVGLFESDIFGNCRAFNDQPLEAVLLSP